jgi:hypothetical protein
MSITKPAAATTAVAIMLLGTFMASPSPPALARTAADPTAVVSIEGTVKEIGTCVSQEFPSVLLATADRGDVTVLTGPTRFLLDYGFEIRIGDRVSATAFPSLWHDGVFVALQLANLTTDETLVLRDEVGRPMWSNHGGPGDAGLGWCSGCRLGPQDVVDFDGVVVEVAMGYSLGSPYFTLALGDGSKRTIFVGPYRYMLEEGFQLRAGDRTRVQAFRSYWPDNTYVCKELFNDSTGQHITLREQSGRPSWIQDNGQGDPGGPGGPNGYRMGDCTGWIPPSDGLVVVNLDGTVVDVFMAPGEEFPHFTLALANGKRVTIVTGPYYVLLRNAFEIRAGDRMSMRAFESHWYTDTFVAVSLDNLTTGEAIVLRDTTGSPTWPNTQTCDNAGIGYGGGAAWFAGSAGDVVEINGRVEGAAFNYGDGYSAVTIKKNNGKRFTVLLCPGSFLLEQSFEIRDRDRLRIHAYMSEWFDGVYVAAEVRNRTRKQSLTLRDASGRPLWR